MHILPYFCHFDPTMTIDTWWLLHKSMMVWLVNKTLLDGLHCDLLHLIMQHDTTLQLILIFKMKKVMVSEILHQDHIYGVKMCIICNILSRNRPEQIIRVPRSDPRECCDRDRCVWLWTYMLLRLLLLIQLLVSLHLSILRFGQGQRWHKKRLSVSWYLIAKYSSKSCYLNGVVKAIAKGTEVILKKKKK